MEGSYNISNFAIDADAEIARLNAQVDLFWDQEFALYRRFGLKDGMSVLDCGCGSGYLLQKLHGQFAGLESIGIEIEDRLAAAAQRTLKNLARCRVLQQSVTAIDLPESSFDFAICRLVLEHLPNPLLALKEVLRVLKTGGRAVFLANDFDLHERTYPDSPALGELYDAYRRARRSEGGNPCIGRELPLLLKRAGYAEVDLHLLAAHNHVVGDGAFLKAEGAGIPMQLVKAGHLASEALDRIAGQWRTTVTSKDHAIFRMLFAAVGEKPSERDNVSRGSGNLGQDMCVSPTAPGFGRAGPQSHAEIQGFIRETLAVEMSVPVQSLGTDDSLIHLGVDSMAAVGLCNHLESRLGVMLSMAEVLSAKSIGELADKVVLLVNRSNSSAGH